MTDWNLVVGVVVAAFAVGLFAAVATLVSLPAAVGLLLVVAAVGGWLAWSG